MCDNNDLIYETLKKELEKKGEIAFSPRGNSMWPTLKNKAQTVLIKKKTDRLDIYDVGLYYRNDGKIVLHRVVKVESDCYVFCGDSQFYLEKVSENHVIGVMEGFYRGKKYIEVTDEKYVKKIKKLYKHNKIRKIRTSLFFFRNKWAYRFKKLFSLIFKKGNKNG